MPRPEHQLLDDRLDQVKQDLLFIGEEVVEARGLDVDRGRQLSHRRGLITALEEHLCGQSPDLCPPIDGVCIRLLIHAHLTLILTCWLDVSTLSYTLPNWRSLP